MRYLFISLFCYLTRLLFRFRYKIKVVGKKNIFQNSFHKKAGILFLPNHPALMDPVFLFAFLWPRFQMRPLVVEYIYRQKGISFFVKLARALCVPDLDTSMNELKVLKTEKAVKDIVAGLKKGENYLLYPSGKLKRSAKEILGGASATHTILQHVGDVNIVLIRASGLWGSSFSRAYMGTSPNFQMVFLKGIKSLLKSLIFFLPKRRVLIEMELAGKDFPRTGSRLDVNRYLENWFNQYPEDSKLKGKLRVEEEPLRRVSYRCFKKKYLTPFENRKKAEDKNAPYSWEAEQLVFQELKKMQPDMQISKEMQLASDLGFDSLNIAELITFLNQHFHVKEVHPEDMQTVKDVVVIASGGDKKRRKAQSFATYTWPKEKGKRGLEIKGKTIFEAILNTADRLKNQPALGDDLLGVLNYKSMKMAALALSLEIKKVPGKYIGVLLPASIGSDLVILAVMLAGKVPVMMNWTLGSRFLNHMMELTKAKKVISSWRFLERLSGVQFGSLIEQLILIEDIKSNMGLGAKLKALFLSKRKALNIIKALKLEKVSGDAEAVVLFTSGTEANPKGVPLSHKNILTNLRGAVQSVDLFGSDIMLGILPPFHSFGFTVAGLFPLICGMKAAYYPDPTDSYAVAEAMGRWKATMICSAPSFLKGILNAASLEQVKHMRLFVSGAEKTPEELFQKVAIFGEDKKLIEGYGITECSPVLSICHPDEQPKGVGRLLPGIDLITVHPETKEVLPEHSEGEICVFGDSIFHGYLGEVKSPFLSYAGKNWYCTGDLGYLDSDGHLILSGRLKRFVKIGGEMISLGAVEGVLLKYLKEHPQVSKAAQTQDTPASPLPGSEKEGGASIAVLASEKQGQRAELCLFTTLELGKTELNKALKNAGFSLLVKISKIKKIEEIPLMGTGKVDYRSLQKLLNV